MGRISKITVQQKDRGRFNVFLDDEFWLGVSANTLAKFKLYEGFELSGELSEEITQSEIKERLYNRAVGYLSRAMKPRSKVRSYLRNLLYKKKGSWFGEVSPANFEVAIEDILDRLEKLGILDDTAYAKAFSQARFDRKPRAKRVIISELITKGIKKETAESAVAGGSDEDIDLIKRLMEKKYGNTELDIKDRKKIRYLQSKGFSWDLISKIMRSDEETD